MRGDNRRSVHLALALASACVLNSCASVVPADEAFATGRCKIVIDDGVEGLPTYDIGAILEITNPDGTPNFDGKFTVNSIRLAIKEFNDNRDVAGKRFRVRVCDTRSHWSTGGGQVTRDLANWLIDHEHVQAIISDASADTQTIAAVTVQRNVLVMAISSTSAELTNLQDKNLVWRVAPSDIYQGAVLAHMVSTTVAETDAKIVVLAVQSPYGDGLVASLGKQLGSRLKVHTFGTDGKGLTTAVQAAATDGAKAIIIVATSPLVAQIVNARMTLPALADLPLFLADGACDSDLMAQKFQPGAKLKGSLCTRPGAPVTPVYEEFEERFLSNFHEDPVLSSYTQHSYDVMYCLALSHAWALGTKGAGKVDGPALALGLQHLSAKGEAAHPFKPSEIQAMISALGKGQDIDVVGASGPLDFNPETGEAPSAYQVWTLDDKGELKTKTYFAVNDLGKGSYAVLPVDVTPP